MTRILCVGTVPDRLKIAVDLGWPDRIAYYGSWSGVTDGQRAAADALIVGDCVDQIEALSSAQASGVPIILCAPALTSDVIVSTVLGYDVDAVVEGERPSGEVISSALDRLAGVEGHVEPGARGLEIGSLVPLSTGTNRARQYRDRAYLGVISRSTQTLLRTMRSTVRAMDRHPLPTMGWDPYARGPSAVAGKAPAHRAPAGRLRSLDELFVSTSEARGGPLGFHDTEQRRLDYPQPGLALIRGESGSGKSLVAGLMWRAFAASVHWTATNHGRMPFVKVNCAGMTQHNFDHELVGAAGGVWSGIAEPVVGLLPQADYGVAFLDEIGDMADSGQGRLKALLDDFVITPAGLAPYYLHLRVIAATNRLLEQTGFQHDLLQRFDFTLNVPPLAERIEEIPRLVDYIAQDPMINVDHRGGLAVTHVENAALTWLTKEDWTDGNFRELGHVVRGAVFAAAQDRRRSVTLGDVQRARAAKPLSEAARRIVRITRDPIPDHAIEVATADDLTRAAVMHGVPVLRGPSGSRWASTASGTYVHHPPNESAT